jgi:hypothetical protein
MLDQNENVLDYKHLLVKFGLKITIIKVHSRKLVPTFFNIKHILAVQKRHWTLPLPLVAKVNVWVAFKENCHPIPESRAFLYTVRPFRFSPCYILTNNNSCRTAMFGGSELVFNTSCLVLSRHYGFYKERINQSHV